VEKLKRTYEQQEIHRKWESVYRGNPLQDRFNEAILRRLLGYLALPPGAQVLDAGCGVGDHALRFARHGFRCLGVDVSETILREARRNAAAAGLDSQVAFTCQALEELAFPDATFDAVHCRGVLMHIPDWERALQQLCRVLKPGARIVVIENSDISLETAIVLLARRFRQNVSELRETAGGLEFWSEMRGKPFVHRIASIRHLLLRFEAYGLEVLGQSALEFWDINRFPPGWVRNMVIRFNRFWFSLGLPTFPSHGVVVLGQRQRSS
jgi:ubiquinone/menaquinone biosynthesis C-methylase UbiE